MSFFERVRDMANVWASFSEVFGEGTEYEAVARISVGDGEWCGYLVFKDTRFSPEDREFPGIQFKYPTSSAANGVVAAHRAEELWSTLRNVFEGIRPKASPPPGSCVDETSVLK
jgi:hypothetical protein